jgi:hypothetical protein
MILEAISNAAWRVLTVPAPDPLFIKFASSACELQATS